MAGHAYNFINEGGMSQPTLAAVTSGGMGGGVTAGGIQAHHSILGIVLVALIGLWALDHFGFRFAVTAGKR